MSEYGDAERPSRRCHCRACESKGLLASGPDCPYRVAVFGNEVVYG